MRLWQGLNWYDGNFGGSGLQPQPGGWMLLVRYGLAERVLAAQRSKQVRVFRKLDTLVLYLQQIGVSRFEVDASGFMGAPRQIRNS